MSLQFDQLNNQLKTNDSTNANASMVLTPAGTGSVLLNGTGQNLVTYSQDYTNAVWTKGNVTATASGATAPDGTTTAITVLETVTNGTHSLSTTTPLTSVSGLNYTISFYLKANGRNYCAIYEGVSAKGKFFNITAGGGGSVLGNLIGAPVSAALVYVGNDWYRASIVVTVGTLLTPAIYLSTDGTTFSYAGNVSLGIYAWGTQVEIGNTLNAYVPTTTAAIYNAPVLSLSGVANIGLQSDGALYVQPAGTGALQAQATTSTATGGNARGANAVDWSTSRAGAAYVAVGPYSVIGGGSSNYSASSFSTTAGGVFNFNAGYASFIGAGQGNTINGAFSSVVTGYTNTANGIYNFIGGGFTNSGTANAAVTTQSATMNGTTAVTLAASNASIKVGQYISGTYIGADTYVAAVSGTSLTLSKIAVGSGTATLSFTTPHGVVVGGGNNTATGSYSFIGGGGDAGNTTNRNVASGDWSFVGGGARNTASGIGAVVVGGGYYNNGFFGPNNASADISTVGGGLSNNASAFGTIINGGYANTANATYAAVLSGSSGNTRSITGYAVISPSNAPLGGASGSCQVAILNLAKQTTDATPTVLTSDGTAGSTGNQVILPNNSAYYFRGEIVSGVTGGGNTKGWYIEGVIKRGANAASTALVGTPTVMSSYADAGATTWALAVTADTTNGGLAVTFTGQLATTIRTVAQIRTTEMTY